MAPLLVALAGLPGVGKTTLARHAAPVLGAAHLRLDTIEQTMAAAGAEVGAAGYAVAYRVAADILRGGCPVIADTVNPVGATRAAWCAVAAESGARLVEVEVVCSDPALHRARAEGRVADIPGHRLPGWEAIRARRFEPFEGPRIVIDTAGDDPGTSAARLLSLLR